MSKQEEFEALAKPLAEFLQKNYNPHTMVVIDSTSAELYEGVNQILIDNPQ